MSPTDTSLNSPPPATENPARQLALSAGQETEQNMNTLASAPPPSSPASTVPDPFAWATADLAKSGLTPNDVQLLGWYTITVHQHPGIIGFTPVDANGLSPSGYVIPFRDPRTGAPLVMPDGRPFVRVKLERPVLDRDGKDAKYLSLSGAGIQPYIPSEVIKQVTDKPDDMLLFTEGEKKCLCATKRGMPMVGLTGIDCWADSKAARGADGAADLHPLLVPLVKDRVVVMIYDSDANGPNAAKFMSSARRFAAACMNHGAKAFFIVILPAITSNGKTGVDDFLVAGGKTTAELEAYISANLQPIEPSADVRPTVATPTAEAPERWQTAIPLGRLADALPAWPWESFPPVMRTLGQSLAAALNVPSELSGLAVLCIASMSLGNRVQLEIRASHRMFGNVYGMGVLPSGSGKTPCFTPLREPLMARERELFPQYQERLAQYNTQRIILEEKISCCKAKIRAACKGEAAATSGDAEEAAREMSRYQKALIDLGDEPAPPRLYTEDCTSEKMKRLLLDNLQCLSLLSGEARKVMAVAGGRYVPGSGDDLDALLCGWSAEPLRVDRGSRPAVTLTAPVLAALLALQPTVLRDFAASESVRQSGILARFLYIVHEGCPGDYPKEDIAPAALAAFHTMCLTLLRWPLSVDTDRKSAPHPVRLTPAAFTLWERANNESKRQSVNEPDAMKAWVLKKSDQIARIALIFHAALHASGGTALGMIEESEMFAAISLVQVFEAHARRAFAVVGDDAVIALARKVWAWILSNQDRIRAARLEEGVPVADGRGLLAVKDRDLYSAGVAGLKTPGAVHPVLARLETHGYLQSVEWRRPKVKATTLWYLNPAVLERITT